MVPFSVCIHFAEALRREHNVAAGVARIVWENGPGKCVEMWHGMEQNQKLRNFMVAWIKKKMRGEGRGGGETTVCHALMQSP